VKKKKKGHHHHHKTTTTTPSPDEYDDYLDDPSPTTQSSTAGTATEEPSTKKPLRLVYKVPYRDVFYDYTVGHDEDPDHREPPRRRVPAPEEPFSSVETLVWDWQAVVLISAIATCVIFLIVIAIYTCYYAQQWRKIKKTFDSGEYL